ncbi:uncharacterized protein B0T15DRAFT_319 [Chaetomium strumarium]|uniref:C2H2-type domain-containing protein n=1 Tax=Chaetomium strumarium TaxID=1170767 RepID=A0AAJ0H013_9PEZI|nr:hypothetical protein B0T15DRAFT_319 [Chaetomium strumarium]
MNPDDPSESFIRRTPSPQPHPPPHPLLAWIPTHESSSHLVSHHLTFSNLVLFNRANLFLFNEATFASVSLHEADSVWVHADDRHENEGRASSTSRPPRPTRPNGPFDSLDVLWTGAWAEGEGHLPVSTLFLDDSEDHEPASAFIEVSIGKRLELPTPCSENSPSSPGDAASIAISSDSGQVDGKDGYGFQLFKQVLRRLIIAHQAETAECNTSQPTPRQGDREAGTSQPGRQAPTDSPAVTKQRKRQRGSDQDSGEDEDGCDGRRAKQPTGTSRDAFRRQKFLACPFGKLDPNKYWECFLKRITTISYVKQHLSRKHTPDFFCPRCYTIFAQEPVYETHVLAAACSRGPSARLDGISPHQSRQLSS